MLSNFLAVSYSGVAKGSPLSENKLCIKPWAGMEVHNFTEESATWAAPDEELSLLTYQLQLHIPNTGTDLQQQFIVDIFKQ